MSMGFSTALNNFDVINALLTPTPYQILQLKDDPNPYYQVAKENGKVFVAFGNGQNVMDVRFCRNADSAFVIELWDGTQYVSKVNFYQDALQIRNGVSMVMSYQNTPSTPPNFNAKVFFNQQGNFCYLNSSGEIKVLKTEVEKVKEITKPTDFPNIDSDNKKYVLDSGWTYILTKDINLADFHLECGVNVVIKGQSSENTTLTTLSTEGCIKSTSGTVVLRDLTITAPKALDLNGSGASNKALDWSFVNFKNCDSIGSIIDFDNIVLNVCASLDSGSLDIGGTYSSFVAVNSFFNPKNNGSAGVYFYGTVNRRIRFTDCAFFVPNNSFGILVDSSTTLAEEAFILNYVNFSGSGSYIQDTGNNFIDGDNIAARFDDCRGILNTSVSAQGYQIDNTVNTNLVIADTFYPLIYNLTDAASSPVFTVSGNTITYNSPIQRKAKITVTGAMFTTNSNIFRVRLAKNGIVSQSSQTKIRIPSNGDVYTNLTLTDTFVLQQGDSFNVHASSANDNRNVRPSDINIIIEALN